MSGSLLNEYIEKRMSAMDLENELMRLIKEYNKIKKSFLVIIAADMEKATSQHISDISLSMSDYQILHEMLRKCHSKSIDIYIETPGGSGEATEEIVEFLHTSFDTVDFVIAGEAKSAGTLMALSADEIYMTDSGSLGPIDAQVRIGRSVVSAFDYVQWMETKRKEAEKTKQLNPVDATMIAQITPGEFEGVFHAQQLAVDKLREWLPKYKFKHWEKTQTRKIPVTDEMKKARAEEIANNLIDHSKWRSHGRSLKRKDLEELGLRINNLEEDPPICEIVYRIKTVIKLLFGSSTHFKMYITAEEKIFRDALTQGGKGAGQLQVPIAEFEVKCPKCGKRHLLYAKFGSIPSGMEKKIKEKAMKFPASNKLDCECGFQFDLTGLRNQIEKQTGQKIID